MSQEKTYEDLSVEEFCAGYLAIVEQTQSGFESHHMLVHLKELMYLATKYMWSHVLNYHAACLMEIERGNFKWGDSFQALVHTTLAGGLKQLNTRDKTGFRSRNVTEGVGDAPVLFCKNFQKGTCSFKEDHNGPFKGGVKFQRHICAKCWLETKKFANHAEGSSVCPLT